MAHDSRVVRTASLGAATVLTVAAVFALSKPTPPPRAAPSTSPAGSSGSATSPVGAATARVRTTGPGLTVPGINVVARVDNDGTLDVQEKVLLDSPVLTIRLAAAAPPLASTEALKPVVTELQAQSAQGPVTMPQTLTQVAQSISFGAPVTSFTMRYKESGGQERSNPAPVGRALLVLGPIAAPDLASTPVVVQVIGDHVLNLTCPDLPQTKQVCGVAEATGRTAGPMQAYRATMIVQVNLPGPGGS